MSAPIPRLHCRACAFEYFARHVPLIDSSGGEGLLAAAIAISMHELAEIEPHAVEQQLQNLADTVAARIPKHIEQLRARQPVDREPVLAHLHAVLFEEFGFRGNLGDYYNPHNSYVPSVLESRCGIPITLTLIYKNVAERLGLEVHGINAPGHFLAAIDLPHHVHGNESATEAQGSGRMYIDPFNGGRVLNKDEVLRLLEQTLGRSLGCERNLLCPADNRQWLNRILQNLQNIFAFTRREHDLAAMQEMAALLQAV